MMMKSHFLKFSIWVVSLFILGYSAMFAQDKNNIFNGYLYNSEYQVFLKINFTNNNIVVEGQEVFGEVPGYFGAIRDTRKWLITEAKKKNENIYALGIANDYGSEDLSAMLRYNGDGTYTLKQINGSRIKIVVNRKWVKLPTEMTFMYNTDKK